MATEIERKFLVRAERLPGAEALGEGDRFAQGYLSIEPAVRVRVAERAGAAPRAWITVKGPGLLSRSEFEYEVPAEDGRAMMALCVASLRKTRWRVRVDGHVWDLDRYDEPLAGLWVAEVELDAADEDFERPEWVAEEVSHDPRYSNVAIALGKGARGP